MNVVISPGNTIRNKVDCKMCVAPSILLKSIIHNRRTKKLSFKLHLRQKICNQITKHIKLSKTNTSLDLKF